MKPYIRIRKEPNLVILETLPTSADPENIYAWDCINSISKHQLDTFTSEEIDKRVHWLENKLAEWVQTGLYEPYTK